MLINYNQRIQLQTKGIFSIIYNNSIMKTLNSCSKQSEGAQFRTDINVYRSTYENHDNLQRYTSSTFYDRYIEIFVKKYQEVKRPLVILDLCCGYGLQAYQFYEKLTQRQVQIQTIIGYDISNQLIGIAKEKYQKVNSKVQFHIKNVQKDFNDVDRFDVVYCYFALHWMNNLNSVVQNINRSLKKGGILLAFTAIETTTIDNIQKQFIEKSHWKQQLSKKNYIQKQFPTFQCYQSVFTKHLDCQIVKESVFQVTYPRMIWRNVFQGYFQVVRCLIRDLENAEERQRVAANYLDEYLDCFTDLEGQVQINGKEITIRYSYVYLEATRK